MSKIFKARTEGALSSISIFCNFNGLFMFQKGVSCPKCWSLIWFLFDYYSTSTLKVKRGRSQPPSKLHRVGESHMAFLTISALNLLGIIFYRFWCRSFKILSSTFIGFSLPRNFNKHLNTLRLTGPLWYKHSPNGTWSFPIPAPIPTWPLPFPSLQSGTGVKKIPLSPFFL